MHEILQELSGDIKAGNNPIFAEDQQVVDVMERWGGSMTLCNLKAALTKVRTEPVLDDDLKGQLDELIGLKVLGFDETTEPSTYFLSGGRRKLMQPRFDAMLKKLGID